MMVAGRRLQVGRSKGEHLPARLKALDSIAQGNALCKRPPTNAPCKGAINGVGQRPTIASISMSPLQGYDFFYRLRRAAGRIRPLPYAIELRPFRARKRWCP